MFQPTKIRKNLVNTVAVSKSIFQQMSLPFIPKFLSFYNFISDLIPTMFNKEDTSFLFEDYAYASQNYKLTDAIDIYSNLNTDYVYNHKIYSNYLEISAYKIIDSDHKFLLSKIYKNKNIPVKGPFLNTNITLDNLFYLKQKLKLEFEKKIVSGQVVINKYYFFKTY